MSTPGTTTTSPTHSLDCLDVWGGNNSFDGAISVPGLDVWVWSQPYESQARGGDIYYTSMCRCHSISRFVIADVSGHGEEVDNLARQLRKLMRKHINTPDQTQLVRSLNRTFERLKQEGRFATALLATYYPPTDHLIICNAGHPPPIWFNKESGAWRFLTTDVSGQAGRVTNLPLGVIGKTTYTQFAVKLGLGDIVLVYTDPLIESMNPAGKMLGSHGLMELAVRLDTDDPQEACQKLLGELAEYRNGAPPEDDQTLLVLSHNASDPPKMSLAEKMRVMTKMLRLVGN